MEKIINWMCDSSFIGIETTNFVTILFLIMTIGCIVIFLNKKIRNLFF